MKALAVVTRVRERVKGREVLFAGTHDRLFQALGTLDFFDQSQLGTTVSYVSVFSDPSG